jgi:hypothetical protein
VRIYGRENQRMPDCAAGKKPILMKSAAYGLLGKETLEWCMAAPVGR